MSDDFCYTIQVVRGRQGNKNYLTATVPLSVLSAVLLIDDDPDFNKRSQRELSIPRAKAFADYLTKNQDDFFVIPPLLGSIIGEYKFKPVKVPGDELSYEFLGQIEMPITSKVKLWDGQTRAFGIQELITKSNQSKLRTSLVPIMFFEDLTLIEEQQGFHDVNHYQKVPNTSLCIAYNNRDPYTNAMEQAIAASSNRHLIEYERNSVSGKSNKLYSIKNMYDFFCLAVGKNYTEQTGEAMSSLLHTLDSVLSFSERLDRLASCYPGCIPAQVLREKSILGQAVTLKALGLVLRQLSTEIQFEEWRERLEPLSKPGLFDRENDVWRGRCINEMGKLMSNGRAVGLTANALKTCCGMVLTPDERTLEQSLKSDK